MSSTKNATHSANKAADRARHEPVQPLRRGDACLMCRAKKLKCSAHKPVCDQCRKRNDRCVYDASRPASRVEKLQRKLAEMEEEEMLQAYEARMQRRSAEVAANITHQSMAPAFPQANSVALDNGLPYVPIPHLGMEPYERSISRSENEGMDQVISLAGSRVSPHLRSRTVELSPALSGSDQSKLTELPNTPLPGTWGNGIPPVINDLTESALNHAIMVPPPIYAEIGVRAAPVGMEDMFFSADDLIGGGSPLLSAPDYGPGDMSLSAGLHCSPSPPIDLPSIPPPLGTYINVGDMSGQLDIVDVALAPNGNQDEAMQADLTQSTRDYLLNLFFQPVPPRPQVGSEVFSEIEFRSKLSLSTDEQPHPCLLYSMYTIASSHSYIPAIRKLGDLLYAITISKLDIAVREGDRLVDAINANKNLSKWLFSQGRDREGYLMSCRAISLCVACGLHDIRSSTVNSEAKMSGYLLPPARTQQEIRERIHAFWSTWGNDRGGCFVHGWPSAIRDDLITTPLPRQSQDYFDVELQHEPDFTLKDLYNLPCHANSQPLKSLYSYTLATCHLLYRAVTLASQPPEHTSAYGSAPSQRSASLRQTHPRAYSEIMQLSLWLEATMPEQWRMPADGNQWSEPDVPVIAIALQAVRMHLHPLDGDVNDRNTGIGIALAACDLIKRWLDGHQPPLTLSLSLSATPQPSTPRDMGLHSGAVPSNGQASTRNVNGISGPYRYAPTLGIVERLLRGARSLEDLGMYAEAQQCMVEPVCLTAKFKFLARGTNCAVLSQHVEKLEQLFRS
ncbi:hypothetical protein IAU60_003849 [Kwoniella sp. DSM 27419]